MNMRAVLATGAVMVLVGACKKNDPDTVVPTQPPPSLQVSSFSNLTTGNYWVYEVTQVDSMDVAQAPPYRLDSLYVIGDTVLDGETFAMLRLGVNGQPGSGVRYYWRDSADCIVERNGWIPFSATTFDQVLYTETTGGPIGVTIDYIIPSETVPITVPAGSYDAYLVLGQCTSFGYFPEIPEWKFPRDYWAEGVGRVKWYDHYSTADIGYRYELVRYLVQ